MWSRNLRLVLPWILHKNLNRKATILRSFKKQRLLLGKSSNIVNGDNYVKKSASRDKIKESCGQQLVLGYY